MKWKIQYTRVDPSRDRKLRLISTEEIEKVIKERSPPEKWKIKDQKEEKEKGTEEVFETINNWELSKINDRTKPQIQETQRIPSRKTSKNLHQKVNMHNLFKLQKIKDKKKILKETRGKKQFTYRTAVTKITLDFSSETRQRVE